MAGQIALRHTRMDRINREEREVLLHVIGELNPHLREVDGLPQNARRRSGFQPPDPEIQLLPESGGEFHGGRIPCPSTGHVPKSVVHFPVQERSCGKDDGGGADLLA